MPMTVSATSRPGDAASPRKSGRAISLSIAQVPLEQIVTRGTGQEPDEDLVNSMARCGLLTPLDLRARNDATYELVGGSRRLIGARRLGWRSIAAIVEPVEAATLPAALKAALVNLHRRNLQQIHLAQLANQLLDQEGWTQAELARKLGLGRSTPCTMIRVHGCDDLVAAVEREGLEFGAAKALAWLPPADRRALLTPKFRPNYGTGEHEQPSRT